MALRVALAFYSPLLNVRNRFTPRKIISSSPESEKVIERKGLRIEEDSFDRKLDALFSYRAMGAVVSHHRGC